MTKPEQKYTFHIRGMHCQACVLLTESELGDLPNVSYVKSSLVSHTVEIVGDFGGKENVKIAEELTIPLKKHGYTISTERFDFVASEEQVRKSKWSDFKFALPIAFGFALLFFLLQKLGIVNLIGSGQVTYGTAFFIGIIASLSTCMAVVGGLLLSMSATFAKEDFSEQTSPSDFSALSYRKVVAGEDSGVKTDKANDQHLNGAQIKMKKGKYAPHFMFHIGRLVSFFILGGVIGAIGSAFTLNASATFILSLIIGLVMLILGINLLDVFPWAKRFQPAMPKFIGKYAHGVSKFNHSLTPLLVGVATFFLPCGYTQSMQLYSLTTGNFLTGALTMLIFALGTLPVLALVSFSSFRIKNSHRSGIFFKSAGLIVILFALFNIINSLVVVGLIPPVFNF
ncbi:MAG: sulfite exporter TauE/SafE family protein [Candidatus Paceibacterota bacterium]